MEKLYVEDEDFKGAKYLDKGDYENCTFKNCELSNTDLSQTKFIDCEFTGCNLSMAKLIQTAFQNITFKDCKLVGLHFDNCNDFLFAASFENCMLKFSSFYQLDLKNTLFKNTTLHEVDFSETDLSGSLFDNCDLLNAIFENTILEKTDFRSSYHYSINPERNKMKKARFSVAGIAGLLRHCDIIIT